MFSMYLQAILRGFSVCLPDHHTFPAPLGYIGAQDTMKISAGSCSVCLQNSPAVTSFTVYEDLLAPFVESLDEIHAADVVRERRFEMILSVSIASTNEHQRTVELLPTRSTLQ